MTCDHMTVDHETATSPNPAGHLTVTEHCECGGVLGTYETAVI